MRGVSIIHPLSQVTTSHPLSYPHDVAALRNHPTHGTSHPLQLKRDPHRALAPRTLTASASCSCTAVAAAAHVAHTSAVHVRPPALSRGLRWRSPSRCTSKSRKSGSRSKHRGPVREREGDGKRGRARARDEHTRPPAHYSASDAPAVPDTGTTGANDAAEQAVAPVLAVRDLAVRLSAAPTAHLPLAPRMLARSATSLASAELPPHCPRHPHRARLYGARQQSPSTPPPPPFALPALSRLRCPHPMPPPPPPRSRRPRLPRPVPAMPWCSLIRTAHAPAVPTRSVLVALSARC
ncbi:hypothetical protein PLICRDRAFT_175100 [Plicaturopsis crispa FD-325 SS-3]|nr:hypothetical protein PLICRDRAFT_175100 [Plicaturopsis crispa FD-325 SS-3]